MQNLVLHLKNSVDHKDLWYAFKRGDQRAFAYINKRHNIPLISYGFKITNGKNEGKEYIQDLFVEMWEIRRNQIKVNLIRFYIFKSLRQNIIRNLKVGGK